LKVFSKDQFYFTAFFTALFLHSIKGEFSILPHLKWILSDCWFSTCLARLFVWSRWNSWLLA